MKDKELRHLIEECLMEKLINESDLDHLRDNVWSGGMIGKSWQHLVYNLQTLIEEATNFDSSFVGYSPTANAKQALHGLLEIQRKLEEIKPVIIGMADIERKDSGM